MRFAVVADLPGAGRVGQTRSLRPVALLDLGADHHARVQIHTILQLSSQRFRLPFNEADVGQAPRLARLGSRADHRLVERDVLAQRLDSSTILFLVDSRRATAPHAHLPRHKEDVQQTPMRGVESGVAAHFHHSPCVARRRRPRGRGAPD